jgi:17beta-estradiol 17-dehydrogenase / very-long-chain 3-oxoacyl-CoA reductase
MLTLFVSDKKDIYTKISQQLADVEVGVLVNNVGVSYEHAEYFTDIKEEDVDRLIQVNIKAATYLTRAVLPSMKQRKKGAIVFVSSISGVSPAPLLAVYSASKAYLDYLAKCLSAEYKGSGIFVQSVAPALVATNLSKIRRPKLAIPSASAFARSAVSTIGHDHSTSGYWFHAIQKGTDHSLSFV